MRVRASPITLQHEARVALKRHLQRESVGECFAPGRVNLIGEHTDYNDGFVLPCALDVGTAVAIAPRTDNRIVAISESRGRVQRDEFSLEELPEPLPRGAWANYLRGMVAAALTAGQAVSGMDLAIVGNVPQGVGLSSSASLSVALGKSLLTVAEHGPAPHAVSLQHIARQAQWTEHHYAGCLCGIMDQMAAAMAAPAEALLLDCRDLTLERMALPEDWCVLIVDSGTRRELVAGEYNQRRLQCEAAARHYRVSTLRELSSARLSTHRGALDDVCFRRARHVLTENERVLQAAAALKAADLRSFGAALRGSHESLRTDFEVTVPEVDALAAMLDELIAHHADGRGGARMTGGGFGGCVIAVIEKPTAELILAGLRQSLGERQIFAVGL
ncbi:MAG: galactokinase [Sinobacteraceae bacterium]|nr:galactokinase [Nevskiaceae bacterium]